MSSGKPSPTETGSTVILGTTAGSVVLVLFLFVLFTGRLLFPPLPPLLSLPFLLNRLLLFLTADAAASEGWTRKSVRTASITIIRCASANAARFPGSGAFSGVRGTAEAPPALAFALAIDASCTFFASLIPLSSSLQMKTSLV